MINEFKIILLIISVLLLTTFILLYKLGKNSREQEILKYNIKLKKKFNKNNVKDINKVKECLNKGKFVLFIVLLLLNGCSTTINTTCLQIQNYTIEEQQEILNILNKENNIVLNKFITDYYNLRQSIRICNE